MRDSFVEDRYIQGGRCARNGRRSPERQGDADGAPRPPSRYRSYQANADGGRSTAFRSISNDGCARVFSMTTALVGGTALLGESLARTERCVVLIEDDLITGAGAAQEVEIPAGAAIVDASGLTLLPGFIDAHVHIALAPPSKVAAGGVTHARDLAWIPQEIWPLVERSHNPDSEGPDLSAVGQMLTAPGGYPTRATWAPDGVGREVRSADDARSAVAEQAESGASAIKVALNAAAGPTLPARVLSAIVGAAHGRGLHVTAHVTGLGELHKAIDAGVGELAHMLMSEERIPDDTIAGMARAGIVIVPTLSCRFGSELESAIDNLRRFLDAGGRVVYGTDLGNEGPRPGIEPREIAAMSAAGMGSHAIIASATTEAANWLGLRAKGTLGAGMSADVIGVRGDPIVDASALGRIELVFRQGRRVR
jgi:imidazolonepropionase-like amidohydrolase